MGDTITPDSDEQDTPTEETVDTPAGPKQYSYFRTKEGILKLAQLTSTFLGFISVQCTTYSGHPNGKFFSTISAYGTLSALLLIILYNSGVVDKCYKIPWVKFELFHSGILALCTLQASCVVVPLPAEAFQAAAVFGFCATIFYGIEAYLKYRIMKGDVVKQDLSETSKEAAAETTPTPTV